jgi:hypothetical protein
MCTTPQVCRIFFQIVDKLIIENGIIIASKPVVVRDIETYSTGSGNPAKLIGERFSADVIAFLNIIKWQDWTINNPAASSGVYCSLKVSQSGFNTLHTPQGAGY